uniref:Uncharacterized protein n=1 Tax=Panagrolaimus sp. ES5 TaxID=591445 RepID=A0AC34FFD1_9BILA
MTGAYLKTINLNSCYEKDKIEKQSKKDNVNAVNSSTLSLHIAAYENFSESKAAALVENKIEKTKEAKSCTINLLSLAIQVLLA